MFFKRVDLTTALRPSLLPDETLLFVQDAVGLYEGKYKIPAYQRGHAYLTSHRACYIDDADPRNNSVALDLRDVDRAEIQAGFLRSSAKITLFPKASRADVGSLRLSGDFSTPTPRTYPSSLSSPVTRTSSPFTPNAAVSPRLSTGTWVCPICSFSNPVPSNFDAANATSAFPIPPCLTCGMKPPFAHVLKAAVAAAVPRQNATALGQEQITATPEGSSRNEEGAIAGTTQSIETTVTCPRCTFHNHPSLLSCEVCGAPLLSSEALRSSASRAGTTREESPGPRLDKSSVDDTREPESVKFSFRAGGEKFFYERLKGALIQRKWLLRNAPPIPKPAHSAAVDRIAAQSGSRTEQSRLPSPSVGIAGLEQRGMQSRKNNELVIGNAFEDLEALMASAREIVALAEKFALDAGGGSSQADSVISESAAALGMVITKDHLGGASESLYISELSRNLAEYLTDDRKGVLKGEGGIMSLVDLWAVFNRSRNGVELVSPSDFEKAAGLWEKLELPVRLRRFKSGLLVVQRREWNDEKIINQLKVWFQEMHILPPAKEEEIDWRLFGRGITAQEAAQRFGWSVGVASEELEMAEEKGVLCREEGIEGLKFWENHLMNTDNTTYLVE